MRIALLRTLRSQKIGIGCTPKIFPMEQMLGTAVCIVLDHASGVSSMMKHVIPIYMRRVDDDRVV
jgi:hypothetical protein